MSLRISSFKRRNRESGLGGFTLLEVMLSVLVLSVGLLAIGAMQITAIEGNAHAGRYTEAATVAQDTLERLMALPYGDANLADNSGTGDEQARRDALRRPLPPLPSPAIPNPEGYPQLAPTHQQDRGGYTVYWNVADNLDLVNTKSIHVVVTWTERSALKAVHVEYTRARIL